MPFPPPWCCFNSSVSLSGTWWLLLLDAFPQKLAPLHLLINFRQCKAGWLGRVSCRELAHAVRMFLSRGLSLPLKLVHFSIAQRGPDQSLKKLLN